MREWQKVKPDPVETRPRRDPCRLIILGQSPAPAAGKEHTFSFLFPMEKLFEEFVAAFVCRYKERICPADARIYVQGRRERKFLVKEKTIDKVLLKPDIVINSANGNDRVIIDTKWKHLKTTEEDVKNGISPADMYQLYAYAHRYECDKNIPAYLSTRKH